MPSPRSIAGLPPLWSFVTPPRHLLSVLERRMVAYEASSPPIVGGRAFREVREKDKEMDHGREKDVGDEGEGEGDGGRKE